MSRPGTEERDRAALELNEFAGFVPEQDDGDARQPGPSPASPSGPSEPRFRRRRKASSSRKYRRVAVLAAVILPPAAAALLFGRDAREEHDPPPTPRVAQMPTESFLDWMQVEEEPRVVRQHRAQFQGWTLKPKEQAPLPPPPRNRLERSLDHLYGAIRELIN